MTLRSRYQRSQYGRQFGRQFGRGASAYGTPGEFVSNQGAGAGGMSEYLRQLIEQMQRQGGGGGGQGGAGGTSTGYVSPNAIPNYPYDPNKPWNGGVRDGRFVPRWPTADQIENTLLTQGFRFVRPSPDGKQAIFATPDGRQITFDPGTGTQDPLTPGESGFNYGTTPAGAPRPTTASPTLTGGTAQTPTPISATGGVYAGMSSDGRIVFYKMPDGTIRSEISGVLQGAGNTAGGELVGSGQSPQGPVQFWKMPDGTIRTTVGGQVQPTAQPAPQTPSAPPSSFMPSPYQPPAPADAVAKNAYDPYLGGASPVVEGTQQLSTTEGGGAPKFLQPQMPSPATSYDQPMVDSGASAGGGIAYPYGAPEGSLPYPQYYSPPQEGTPEQYAPSETVWGSGPPDAGIVSMTPPPDPFMGYMDMLGMAPPPDVLEVPVVPEPFSAMTANSDSIFA